MPVVGNGRIALVADRALGPIDADDGDADRVAAAAFELHHLVAKVVDHAVDLFDHGLRQNLDLNADLDSRESA